MAFECAWLLEGSVTFRASYGLSSVRVQHEIRRVYQWFKSKVWDEYTNIWHWTVHGFEAVAFPSVRHGLLDPPLVSENGSLIWWFVNIFEEICRGFMGETHWRVSHDTMMCIDHADELTKIFLSQAHFMNAILNCGQNTLLIQLETRSKWMNITHEPRLEITKTPLCSCDATSGSSNIPCTIADYDP